MSAKFSTAEPAERPHTVALSPAEVIALANWHISMARKIPKQVGAVAMGEGFENIFSAGRRAKILFQAAREHLNAHIARAKELSSIVNRQS